jgi:hypothetical protein
MVGTCNTHVGDKKEHSKISARKSEAMRPLRKFGHRWQDNIKILIKETTRSRGVGKFIYLNRESNVGLMWAQS